MRVLFAPVPRSGRRELEPTTSYLPGLWRRLRSWSSTPLRSCELGGVLIEWRGRREAEAERLGLNAARQLGMDLAEIRRVEPYEGARDHHLHIYLKSRETPSGFPRRAGMARKRPLVG